MTSKEFEAYRTEVARLESEMRQSKERRRTCPLFPVHQNKPVVKQVHFSIRRAKGQIGKAAAL